MKTDLERQEFEQTVAELKEKILRIKRENVAIHEAGHAVMAKELGYEVLKIEIKKIDSEEIDAETYYIKQREKDEEYYKKEISCALAGGIANEIFDYMPAFVDNDVYYVVNLIKEYFERYNKKGVITEREFLEKIADDTKKLLIKNMAKLQAIKNALLENPRLDQKEINRLYDNF